MTKYGFGLGLERTGIGFVKRFRVLYNISKTKPIDEADSSPVETVTEILYLHRSKVKGYFHLDISKYLNIDISKFLRLSAVTWNKYSISFKLL